VWPPRFVFPHSAITFSCTELYCNSEVFYFFQVITVDPSKHCHAVKLLDDKADDCENRVEELTWCLDNDKCQKSLTSELPILNGNHSKNRKCKFSPSTGKTFDRHLPISAKTEKPKKESPLKRKSHISSQSEQEVETKHLSTISKRQKLHSSPTKMVQLKKQQINGNISASVSKSSVDKLSSDKKVKSAETEVIFGGHDKLDSVKSKVQLHGDQDHWSKEKLGVVSFTDEMEMNKPFPPRQKTPVSYPRQESVYSEFESAVINEFVDRKPAKDVGRYHSNRIANHDSSDEDAFDLIASGRINKLMWWSPASRSNCNRSQYVDLDHQTDRSSVLAEADHNHTVTKHQTLDTEADNYDSASSADTDVVIRSHRLMSEVKANLQNPVVNPLQPNPNSALNAQSPSLNASRKKRLSSVDQNVSSSQNQSASNFSTERKQKRKHCSLDGSEAVAKNCDTSVNSPSVPELTTVIGSSILPKGLSKSFHRSEHKHKQKSLKKDDPGGKTKNSASNADGLLVQQPKSVSMPNLCDIDKSDIKQSKTDVSSLIIF